MRPSEGVIPGRGTPAGALSVQHMLKTGANLCLVGHTQ